MLTSSYAGHSKYADRDGEPRYSAGAPFNYDDKSTEPLPPHGVFEFDYVSTNTAHREALEAPLPSQVFRALELDLCTVWSRVVNTNVKKPKGLGIAGAASKTLPVPPAADTLMFWCSDAVSRTCHPPGHLQSRRSTYVVNRLI